ncbi:MAG: hypothetical protein ACREDS_01430 [Limisphaerales bacterium]
MKNMVGNWNLPGEFVNEQWQNQEWVVTDPSIGAGYYEPYGSVNYRIDSGLLANTNITSCWFINKPGGSVSVGVNLQFSNGQTASIAAKGNISVYRPSVNQPVLFGPYGAAITSDTPPMLELADNAMYFKVTINSKYDGSFGLTQLVNMYSETVVVPPDVLQGATTFGNFNLDGGEYYDGQFSITNSCQINDAPGQSLIFFAGSYTGNWKDYVRFTPTGGIPVTIGRIDWNWSATAENPGTGWYISSDGVDGPTLYDDDSFPVWSSEGITQF